MTVNNRKHMKHLQLYEKFISESDWYEVKQWSDKDQKTVSYFSDTEGSSIKYKIGDVVALDAYGGGTSFGQIVTIFKNEDTTEYLYGIRIFSERGTTSLGKYEESEIIGIATDIPDYVSSNEKFEKK